jgi:hypothetical protein
MIQLLIRVRFTAILVEITDTFIIVPSLGINLDRDSMKTVYEKFGLEPGTQDFIGHAMALYLDDEYVDIHLLLPSRPKIAYLLLPTLAISPNPLDPHMTVSSSTHLPWLAMANLRTSTLFMVSANYHNHSLVSVLFTEALICWTNV